MQQTPPKSGNHLDKSFGRTIAYFRKLAGLSQAELGRALDVSAQQVQKYENGLNRVSVGRAIRISQVLDVPLMILLDMADQRQDWKLDRQAQRMLRNFQRIDNPVLRKAVGSLVKTLAGES